MNKFKRFLSKVGNVAFCVMLIVLLVLIWRKTNTNQVHVLSASMEPTVLTGNYYDYKRTSDVDRFDVIVFELAEIAKGSGTNLLVKRIIGVPGDNIKIVYGEVYVNNEAVMEPYVVYLDKEYCGVFTIPDNCYFVLGDNRANSYDSRFWANPFIDKTKVLGKVKVK